MTLPYNLVICLLLTMSRTFHILKEVLTAYITLGGTVCVVVPFKVTRLRSDQTSRIASGRQWCEDYIRGRSKRSVLSE